MPQPPGGLHLACPECLPPSSQLSGHDRLSQWERGQKGRVTAVTKGCVCGSGLVEQLKNEIRV